MSCTVTVLAVPVAGLDGTGLGDERGAAVLVAMVVQVAPALTRAASTVKAGSARAASRVKTIWRRPAALMLTALEASAFRPVPVRVATL